MKQNQIKIKTSLGELSIDECNVKRLKEGRCRRCNQKVYFFKSSHIKDMVINKINDHEYIVHKLVCVVALKEQERIRLKKVMKARNNNKRHKTF